MRINNPSSHHFQMSIAGKKAKPEETDKQHIQSDKPIELRIQDILDISGKVPKLSGHTENGKYLLDVPDELNGKLQGFTSTRIAGVEYSADEYPGAYDVFLALEDLKTKYIGDAARKSDVTERMADKKQTMQEIADIVQGFNLSDDKRNDFMKQMQALADDYTRTYDTRGNSELLNINDEGSRNSYYASLFIHDIDKANTSAVSGGGGSGWNAHNAELSLQRYEELRTEILKAFGDDKEFLQKNLDSLDKAFEWNLERVATSDSRRVWIDQVMERAAKIQGTEPPYELNKLALNKNFNFDKFEKNAKNLMRQFAQEFIGQIKSGASYATAQDNAMEIMTRSTVTTSVNELSFSDFMIFDGLPWGDATTKAANNAVLSNRNYSFNNNPNLSEELRKILGMV